MPNKLLAVMLSSTHCGIMTDSPRQDRSLENNSPALHSALMVASSTFSGTRTKAKEDVSKYDVKGSEEQV